MNLLRQIFTRCMAAVTCVGNKIKFANRPTMMNSLPNKETGEKSPKPTVVNVYTHS
jgi:hypothetical protein